MLTTVCVNELDVLKTRDRHVSSVGRVIQASGARVSSSVVRLLAGKLTLLPAC